MRRPKESRLAVQLSQRLDNRGHVASILKKPNGRDARSASGKTIGGVRQRNSADGQHRNRDRAADFGKPFESLRRPKCGFRWRGEDGAKKKIVRATARGGFCRLERMAGNADEEIFPFAATLNNPAYFNRRQAFFAEMHAASALRESHVQPVVHEDARCGGFACRRFCDPLRRCAR